MTEEVLVVLLDGQEVGRVTRDPTNTLSFSYADEWRNLPDAYPVSLSMPLTTGTHETEPVEAYVWGLLPDNAYVLDRWARRFQVSARNAFALLANVGEDCAGAVQFVRPARVDELRTPKTSTVEWLTKKNIAQRLRALQQDHSAWRNANDTGQFSLGGAQPKTALLLLDGRWGVPSGRMPTTHILKPPTGDFEGHAENEHFCLELARALGLPAPTSRVQRFDGEVAIVVERYDRILIADLLAGATGDQAALLAKMAREKPILRLHQEDMCQALAVRPTAKYQSDGGPTPSQIVEVLRAYSERPSEDISTFVDALAFNWLVAGTDGHAKNYSILHGAGGRVRLAPLYDLASALPYKDLPEQRLKLAMKIGDSDRLRDILRRNWEAFAEEVRLPPAQVVEQVASLASRLPDAVTVVRKQAAAEGLDHPILDQLAKVLPVRAKRCLRLLRG